MARLAIGLAVVPILTLVGFSILGVAPVLSVVVLFQVLRRAGHFAVERPAREVLYTVLPRTEKYKAKNFNDTFVYRLGDQVGAWSYTAIGVLGFGLGYHVEALAAAWSGRIVVVEPDRALLRLAFAARDLRALLARVEVAPEPLAPETIDGWGRIELLAHGP